MNKKQEIANIKDDQDWDTWMEKPGLKVFDVYARWAGFCEVIQSIFKRIRQEQGADSVSFIVACTDSIEALSKFRNKSLPTFLVFFDKTLVKIIYGSNAPMIEKTIKEQLEIEKNGHPHVPLVTDFTFTTTASHSHAAPAEGPTLTKPVEIVLEDSDTERTLAFIKPDAMSSSTIIQIFDILKRHRIDIIAKRKVWMNVEQVEELYKEHVGTEWFPKVLRFLTWYN